VASSGELQILLCDVYWCLPNTVDHANDSSYRITDTDQWAV